MSEKPSDAPVAIDNGKEEDKCSEPAVHIFSEWCKGCRICVAFCPKQVLEMGNDQKAHVVHEENCIRCFLCARRCPDLAISVIECDRNHEEEDPDTGIQSTEEGDGL